METSCGPGPGHTGTSRWQCSAVCTDGHNLGDVGHAGRLMRAVEGRGGASWSNEEDAKLEILLEPLKKN